MPGLANRLGASLLSFQNGRVVAPPGRLAPTDWPTILVATPMRSGTHVLIDMLLNNLPAYRRRPLYVDLDQFLRRRRRGEGPAPIPADLGGYVVKTHFPTGIRETEADAALVAEIAASAVVLTVERPVEEIRASLDRWSEEAVVGGRMMRHMDDLDERLPRFRAFWNNRRTEALTFRDLFDATSMAATLDRVADAAGVARRVELVTPISPRRTGRIYLDKALTRLLGAAAPRINTTIHTGRAKGR